MSNFPVKSIGVVGGGVVGSAVARTYLEWCDVRVWDILPGRRTVGDPKLVLDCDIVFVCLPTPQKPSSLECDTQHVKRFFHSLHYHYQNHVNFILRSTVPIGFTKRIRERCALDNLVHSPEFLTARTAHTDAMIPSRNIIGAPHGTGVMERLLESVYQARFPGVPTLCMNSDESEAVKLFLNSFFAVKVAFFNECRCFADKLGLDWERVMEGVLSDGRISHAHTKVPGPDGNFGFGGTCLPKDLASLVYQIIEVECLPHITEAALDRNVTDRRKVTKEDV